MTAKWWLDNPVGRTLKDSIRSIPLWGNSYRIGQTDCMRSNLSSFLLFWMERIRSDVPQLEMESQGILNANSCATGVQKTPGRICTIAGLPTRRRPIGVVVTPTKGLADNIIRLFAIFCHSAQIYEANDFGHLGLCFSLKESSDDQSGHTTRIVLSVNTSWVVGQDFQKITNRFKARVA